MKQITSNFKKTEYSKEFLLDLKNYIINLYKESDNLTNEITFKNKKFLIDIHKDSYMNLILNVNDQFTLFNLKSNSILRIIL